ncbi:unnamed protein product [Musa textilis]
MVNFGKKLMANQVQEWGRYYINYHLMKKKVEQFVQQMQQGRKDRHHVLKEFSKMLDDKVYCEDCPFFSEQQGILACRIQELDEQQTKLLKHPDISKISEIREAYAAAGHDLLRLLRFLDLNATGICKILKKFDKSLATNSQIII